LAVPALATLSAGLLGARIVAPASARIGARLLRSGRVGAALAALNLARRPAGNRVIAILGLTVALVSTTTVGWYSSERSGVVSALEQLGAARVLTVNAVSPDQLLASVRRADPTGRDAMAVARSGQTPAGRVLAVDTTRLPSVGLWPETYGIEMSDVVKALTPPTPGPIHLTDGEITLSAQGPASGEPAWVTGLVARPDGTLAEVVFGPIRSAMTDVTAPLAGCPAAQPCRLVGLRSDASSVLLYRLNANGRTVVHPSEFGDLARWRPGATSDGVGSIIAPRGDHLFLAPSPNPLPNNRPLEPDSAAYVVDAPVPLPIVVAGRPEPATPLGDDRIAPLGTGEVPYYIAARAVALPVVGTTGALVDLESAIRVGRPTMAGSVLQVWLTADASPSIVDRLAGEGIVVVREETAASAASRLARQGSGAATGYGLLGAGFSLLLGTSSVFLVAMAQRRQQSVELSAARTQGLSQSASRVAVYAPAAVAAIIAVFVGAACAAVTAAVAAPSPSTEALTMAGGIGLGRHLAISLVVAAALLIWFSVATALSSYPVVREVQRSQGSWR
jgi:hypothetical protein